MYGPAAAVAAGAAIVEAANNIGKKRKASNLTGRSFSSIVNNSRYLIEEGDQGEERRAPAYVTRLHSAKYLKCDPLLKELLFPIYTYANRFGFCSTTSMGGVTASHSEHADTQSAHKAAGCHRGLTIFTLRSQTISSGSVNKLYPALQVVGSTKFGNNTNIGDPILSPYLRFNNGPPLVTPNTAQGVSQALSGGVVATGTTADPAYGMTAPTVSDAAPTDEDYNKTKIRVSECGDINAIEAKAVMGGTFKPMFYLPAAESINNANQADSTAIGQTAGTPVQGWNGRDNIINSDGNYHQGLKNTTIRIADGYLELDISNGKSSPAFIEVVVHAHRKHEASVGTQDLLNAIFNAVQYQQSDRPTSSYYNNTTINRQNPGGWQAFWDPTYPLFGVKSQHRKDVDSIATEVHRSNHMLAAGQSKCVKIYLGNLYYDLGSKFQNSSVPGGKMGFDATGIGAGGLQISVGHSGVKMLTAPTRGPAGAAPDFAIRPGEIDSDGNADVTLGAGYWVGKQFCPSEIVVEGNYVEKFYPSYVVDKERRMWVDKPMPSPSMYNATSNSQKLLPAGQPVTDVVATVSAGVPVPADIQSQYRHHPA